MQGVPDAGSSFVAVADEATARQVAEHRRGKQREADLVKTAKVSLEDLYHQIQAGDVKELRVVIKADVQGSVEALSEALCRLSTEEVRLNVLHASVGGITESDVLAGLRFERRGHRLQRPSGIQSDRRGRARRGRCPALYRDLRRAQRRARCHGRPAGADDARKDDRPCRGPPGVHHSQLRYDRRIVRY